jgi:UDP:flavonoid glycosyltransferase YjiC (YdhE family)
MNRVATVVAFCMPEDGHFVLLAPVLADLAERGVTVHVLTHARFAARVAEIGGRFVDLFARYPLDTLGDDSVPVPCRFVTYAARYAERIADDVRALGPSAVIYETFSVVGRVAAILLGLPYLNVTPGHALSPAAYRRELEADPRVAVSAVCERAVDELRARGITDATPFAYVTGKSPFLNLYGEPPQYLTDEQRAAFEPLAFYGCLRPRPVTRTSRSVYISFGTIIWRYFAAEATAALTALADIVARRRDLHAVIGLGSSDADLARRLARPNVRAEAYVDQWQELANADVFVTHHGINSTHEAVFQQVPMLSYPFFWDQPALAAKCQAFGLAVALVDSPRAPITEERFAAGLEQLRSPSVAAKLEEARAWELALIEGRRRVLDDVMDRFVS